jgi:hypothetical protein
MIRTKVNMYDYPANEINGGWYFLTWKKVPPAGQHARVYSSSLCGKRPNRSEHVIGFTTRALSL